MRNLLTVSILLCLLILTGCGPAATGDSAHAGHDTMAEAPRDGLFIHISSNDPHRVLMALNMAVMMSEDHDVAVYFDIKGIEVVLKDSEDITYAQFPSSHTQIKALYDKGIMVCACPGCLQAAGKTPEDLMEEVHTAKKHGMFGFTKGRILTLDY